VGSIKARIIAKVRALLPEDWLRAAGSRFRETSTQLSGGQDVATAVGDGAARFAVGHASHKHADAVRNYAEEEHLKVETELARRTLESRTRQEEARAEQEETRARMLRTEELMGRLKFFDALRESNALPIWDQNGNMSVVKAPVGFDWDEARNRLLSGAFLPETKSAGLTVEVVDVREGGLSLKGQAVEVAVVDLADVADVVDRQDSDT